MASDEEHHHGGDYSDGEHTHYSQHHQQASLQNLFFPRSRSQIFMPLTSSSSRRNSFRPSGGSRPEYAHRRSQALLQREQTPALAWEKYRKSDDELKSIKNKKVREFYENQNCLIDDLELVDQILDSPAPSKILHSYHHRPSLFSAPSSRRVSFDEESALLPSHSEAHNETNSRIVNLAISVNFAANILLLIAKIIVTLTSSSLSVLASLVDSALDFTSTVIIYSVSKIIQSKDWRSHYQFPVGKARLEPIGVLVFSVIMIVSFIQVGVEAVQRLIRDGETHEVVVLSAQSIVIMASTVVVKFGCWLWSRSIKNSGVQALSQDAMNDVVFNLFSLIFPLIGQVAHIWWLDPVGAIVISIYIIFEWIKTAYSHIQNLTGTSASHAQLQQIIYMASRFSDRILKVMNVSGYHAGDNILVEVDIGTQSPHPPKNSPRQREGSDASSCGLMVVLDEKMPLRDVHDLGEALQYSIESLEGVERVFVHCDYTVGNPSGHIKRNGR